MRSIQAFARVIEKLAARVQGKGFGSHSIEREVACVARLMSRNPALVLDIGANVGGYSMAIRNQWPEAEIHAFEPAKVNIAKLRDRFSSDADVYIKEAAVSDRLGDAPIFSNLDGSGLTSLTKRKLDHIGVEFTERETVSLVRIEDYWVDVLARRPIDFAKLDIEGHELDALRGFGAAIGSTRAVQFEFGGANIDTRTNFRDFWYFFADNGFDMYRISPLGPVRLLRYSERDEFYSTSNFVAIRTGDPE